jgi:hypothetical protein
MLTYADVCWRILTYADGFEPITEHLRGLCVHIYVYIYIYTYICTYKYTYTYVYIELHEAPREGLCFETIREASDMVHTVLVFRQKDLFDTNNRGTRMNHAWRQHMSAYVSIRQHMSAHVSICQHTWAACVSKRTYWHQQSVWLTPTISMLTYAGLEWRHMSLTLWRHSSPAYVSIRETYVSIHQHTSAYVSIWGMWRHSSPAYVSIRQHTSDTHTHTHTHTHRY